MELIFQLLRYLCSRKKKILKIKLVNIAVAILPLLIKI
jgi:hypothetical protein